MSFYSNWLWVCKPCSVLPHCSCHSEPISTDPNPFNCHGIILYFIDVAQGKVRKVHFCVISVPFLFLPSSQCNAFPGVICFTGCLLCHWVIHQLNIIIIMHITGENLSKHIAIPCIELAALSRDWQVWMIIAMMMRWNCKYKTI